MKVTNLSIEELSSINGGSKTTDIIGDVLKITGGAIMIAAGPVTGTVGIGAVSLGAMELISDVTEIYNNISD
ncbi:hypothetical protein [Streptobacillus moniliformis]|uniref:hypothetical protein n=1 Tax=Streptobacillus moniliformis TaxID=34105 RepID=UPI0007E4D64A|nr:hypothetical protein [Streptobacillus moniliformis]